MSGGGNININGQSCNDYLQNNPSWDNNRYKLNLLPIILNPLIKILMDFLTNHFYANNIKNNTFDFL